MIVKFSVRTQFLLRIADLIVLREIRMRRGRRTTVVVCLILFSFVSGTLGFLSLNVSALTPHDEIVIDGDNDFIPANGVVRGSGTPTDPYIIEGWEIAGYTGISISNSQVHFIVRNVYISSVYYGITLTNVNNGRIENATIEGPDYGMQVDSSNNNSIADNSFIGSEYTLHIIGSERNTISNNEFSGYGQWNIGLYQSHENMVYYNSIGGHRRGMYMTEANDNKVSHNSISGGTWGMTITKSLRNTISHNTLSPSAQVCIEIYGGNIANSDNVFSHNLFNECIDSIFASQLRGSEFSHNTFTNSSNGLYLSYSNGNDVLYNTAIDNSRGFYVAFSNDNTFVGNELITNDRGILIANSDPNIIYHNNFIDSGGRDGAGLNQWDDGYPSGGNYWSTYTGVDECSGPNQDICPDPDKIGDTPHWIYGNSKDYYPLMVPYGRITFDPLFSLEAVSSGRLMGDVDIHHTRSRDDRGNIYILNRPETLRSELNNRDCLKLQTEPQDFHDIQKPEISMTQNKFQCLNVLSAKRN